MKAKAETALGQGHHLNDDEENEEHEIMVDGGALGFINPAMDPVEGEDDQMSSHHQHHPLHQIHQSPQSPQQPFLDPGGPRSPQSPVSPSESDIYGGSITSGVLV